MEGDTTEMANMNPEYSPMPGPRKFYEEFGLTEKEQLFWRVSTKRFEEILKDERTIIHDIKESSNEFGDFMFVTTSRPANQGRLCMTFYGLGFHEARERWVTKEWFWYQESPNPELLRQRLKKTGSRGDDQAKAGVYQSILRPKHTIPSRKFV
jgi:hypothetical protein